MLRDEYPELLAEAEQAVEEGHPEQCVWGTLTAREVVAEATQEAGEG